MTPGRDRVPEPETSSSEQVRRTLPAHFREKSPLTDTAGVSWEGRDYTVSPFPGDDGSVPAELAAALRAHRAGEDADREQLVAALDGDGRLCAMVRAAGERWRPQLVIPPDARC